MNEKLLSIGLTVLFLVGAAAALLGAGVVCVQVAETSQGQVDYCYISHNYGSQGPPYWAVFGHVPWHADTMLTRTMDFGEAVRVRDTICRVAPAE